MHRVVAAHLRDFQSKYSISDDKSKQFEAFVSYSVFRSFCAENVDPKELVYDGADPGIDGVMLFLNDSYVSSVEEIEDMLKNRKNSVQATIVFTQSKSSESWNKSEINTFESAVLDFLSDDSKYQHSDYIEARKEIFDKLIGFAGKIQDGKPRVECFFATTARASSESEILAAQKAMEASISESGYFSSAKVSLLNRESVVDLWTASEGQVEATLTVLGTAAFPKAPGIEEGYVATVKAINFIRQILTDGNGRLRQRIFEENVRDFIGIDSEINKEMSETLLDSVKQERFGILNNGITIISPDIRISGFETFMRDYQIVNGCQTSNILFQHKDKVSENATIMLKVVETSDPAVIDDIVRSTNRQAKVEEEQFLATLDSLKAIERYFDARGSEEEYRLYFERRKNQFSSQEDVKAIRVFDIKEIARCAAAMFLDKPEIASRYPNRLTAEMQKQVFDKSYNEEIFHVSAYTLYRLKLLIGNKRIDQRYGKLRWHILMAIKYWVCGANVPQLGSRRIKEVCEEIQAFMSAGDDKTVAALTVLCSSIVDINEITRDKLKGINLVQEIKSKALKSRPVKKI